MKIISIVLLVLLLISMSFNIFLFALFVIEHKKAKKLDYKWKEQLQTNAEYHEREENHEKMIDKLNSDLKREKENHIIQVESFYREPKEIKFSFIIPNEIERFGFNEEYIRTNILNEFVKYCRENYDDVFEYVKEHDIINLSYIVTARFRYIPTTGKYYERREEE